MTWETVRAVSECEEANAGARRTMEDAHCAIDNYGGVPGQCLFAVFDGHGGTGIVKYLEKHFSEALLKQMCLDDEARGVLEAMIATFASMDSQSAQAGITTSGSTAVSCLLRTEENKKILYTANVGDTRAVLCRDGVAERLTHDHTAADQEEVDRIEKAGGFILRKRVLGILSVARAIGDHSMKKYIISQPHTKTTVLKETDQFLIIACDGVWDVFTDEEAVQFVLETLGEDDCKLEETAAKLVKAAVSRGSQDNITALVIHL